MPMKDLLEKLMAGQSLQPAETGELFRGLVREDVAGEMKAAVLTALRIKGETETEVLRMAQEMRSCAVRLPDDLRDAIDTCGTGGDGSRSLNLSTLSAIVLSSMGVPVVKHGNRSVSSSCGSADVLERMGFPIDLSPAQTSSLFRSARFVFLFAPHYHPAMKAVVAVRRAMQTRTIFNFLGPLSNPANVRYQVVGVPHATRVKPFAAVLKGLGLRSAAVVHGDPCLDEISPEGVTRVSYFLDGGPVTDVEWTPRDLGVAPFPVERLCIEGPDEAASRAREVLSGRGRVEDMDAVSMNAGAGMWIAGRAKTPAEGVSAARAHMKTGAVAEHWKKIVDMAAGLKSNAG